MSFYKNVNLMMVFLVILSISLYSQEVPTEAPTEIPKEEQSESFQSEVEQVESRQTESIQEGKIYNDGKIDYANSQTTFSLTSEDNLSDVQSIMYRIDTGNFIQYQAPISIQEEGLHAIHFYSIDNVNNRSPDYTYSVVIDNSPPEVILVTNTNLFSLENKLYAPASAEFMIKANDISSGIKLIEYSIDEGIYNPYSDVIRIDTTGDHTIKYKASDNLENVSQEKIFTVFIDNIKPVVKIIPSNRLFEKDNKSFAPTSYKYTIEAIDTESQVKKILISIDNDYYMLYETPIVISAEGEHIIKAKAIDNVGNESIESSLEVIIDATPPKIELKPTTQ